MEKYFSPKTVSDMTGVSRRTLHHYDAEGLLTPHHVTDAGYRMYDMNNIQTLQHILFLKALGMDLKTIGVYMATSVDAQNEMLRAQYTQLQTTRDRLDVVMKCVGNHLEYYPDCKLDVQSLPSFSMLDLYAKEAAVQYEANPYYVSSQSVPSEEFEQFEQQFGQLCDRFDRAYNDDQSVESKEVIALYNELVTILRKQVPQADEPYMLYMATLYREDERFAMYINKGRTTHLNTYIAKCIEAHVQK